MFVKGNRKLKIFGLLFLATFLVVTFQNCDKSKSGSGISSYSSRFIQGTKVKSLVTGNHHVCALQVNGNLYCWGSNVEKQLGHSTEAFVNKIPAQPTLTGVSEVSAGSLFTCALFNSGDLKCWGNNQFNQLGQPVGVRADLSIGILMSGVRHIYSGMNYSCAIKNDNSLWCWGTLRRHLTFGVTDDDFAVPTNVNVPNAKTVSINVSHYCVILEDGNNSVKCFGNDFSSQGLFGGPEGSVVVVGARSLALDDIGSCAVLIDNTVHCWGNLSGTFSFGGPAPRQVLENVSTIDFGTHMDAFTGAKCIVSSEGKLSCWGGNRFGQLGTGQRNYNVNYSDVFNNPTPAPPALTNAKAVRVGGTFTCAILTSDEFTCWGNNAYGQLGNGTVTDQLTPFPEVPTCL